MAEYVITLFGCDDVTVFRAKLAPAEAALVRRLAALSQQASTKDCQPTLHIGSFDITDELDKVVSLDDRFWPFSPVGPAARLRLAPDLDGHAAGRDRRVGRGGGVRVEPVADAVSGVVGEDRPH